MPDIWLTVYEDTTANITTMITNRVADTTRAQCLQFDTTLDTLVYVKTGAAATDYRYPLTLDENYDSLTQIRRLTMNSAGWIGLSNTTGRIVFTDAAPDSIEMEDCAFHFNPDNDDFDFRLDGDTNDNVFYMDAGNDRIGMGIATPDCLLHLWASSAGTVDAVATAMLTIECNTANALQFLVEHDASSTIYFGDDNDNDVAYIQYNHNTPRMIIVAETNIVLNLDGTNVWLPSANTIQFGVGTTPSYAIHMSGDGYQCYLDQSSETGALPPLCVDQANTDEPFIHYIGTGVAGSITTSIIDDTGVGTVAGYVMVEITDVGGTPALSDGDYYMAVYTVAAP